MRSAVRYGRRRNNTLSTTLKIAVLAPIPSASVITTINVNPGRFNNPRKP